MALPEFVEDLPAAEQEHINSQLAAQPAASQVEGNDPIDSLDPKQYLDLWSSTKDETLNPVNWAKANPERAANPNVRAKLADITALANERGFKFEDLDLGNAVKGVFHAIVGGAKWMGRAADVGVGTPLLEASLPPGKEKDERMAEQAKKAIELGASTEMAVTGLGDLVRKAGSKIGKWVGKAGEALKRPDGPEFEGPTILKDVFTPPTSQSPEQRQRAFEDAFARSDMMDKIGEGLGASYGAITQNFAADLAKQGFKVDPQVVSDLSAGDPVSFLAFSGGFKLVTSAGKVIATAASRAEAVQMLARVRTAQTALRVAVAQEAKARGVLETQKKAFVEGGPIAAPGLAEAPGALRTAQEITKAATENAEQATAAVAASPTARAVGAIQNVAGAASDLVDKVGPAVSGLTDRAVDKVFGAGVVTGGTALRGAGQTVNFVRSFLPPLVTPRKLTQAANLAEGAGQGIQKAGKALIEGNEAFYSPRIRLISDLARTAPDVALGAAKGFVTLDLPLAAATSETPDDTANMPVFATVLGGLGKIPGGAQRIVQSQLIKPKDYNWGTRTQITDYSGVPALNEATRQSVNSAKDPAQVARLSAIRQFVEPTGAQVHWVSDKGNFETILRRYSPGRDEAWYKEAADQRGVTLKVRGEDGQQKNIVVLRDVGAAPHEAVHLLQDALGDEAMQKVNSIIYNEYAPVWDRVGENYVNQFKGPDALADYASRGEGWKEAVLDLGFGNTDWRGKLTPDQIEKAANTYVSMELSAEAMDTVLRNSGPALAENKNFLGKIARILGKTLYGLGIEPFEGVRSEGQGIPVTMRGAEGLREAFRTGIDQIKADNSTLDAEAARRRIEELPTFGKPKTVTKPGEVTPSVEGSRTAPTSTSDAVGKAEKGAREIAENAPSVPLKRGLRSPKEILTDVADAIRDRTSLKIDYLSAPGEPAGSISSNRTTRRAVIEAFRDMPASARSLFEKTFSPERVIQAGGKIQVMGWAPEVFAANAHKFAKAIHEATADHLSPYPIDSKTGSFTEHGWRQLFEDANSFVKNHQGGLTGAGESLVVLKEVTDRGFFAPEVTAEASKSMSQDRADVINALMGIPIPKTPRISGSNFPRNLAGQAVSEATLPGRVSEPVSPRAPFEGAKAKELGIEGQQIKEVNPLKAELDRRGIRPSFLEAIQRLNLENIADVTPLPAEAVPFRPNEFTLQAGFQPREGDVAEYYKLMDDLKKMPLEDQFGAPGRAVQKSIEEIKNRNGGNPPDKAAGRGVNFSDLEKDASGAVGKYEPPTNDPTPVGSVGEGFQPPEPPRTDNTALGIPVEGVDSPVKYAGETEGLAPVRFQPKADGSDVTQPSPSYKDGSDLAKERGGNVWVRQSKETGNADRVLMVQITPDLMYPNGPDPISTPYYDKLYSGARKGYDRAQDFWELPQWAAVVAHNLGGKADFYAVRDVAEAQKFLASSNYGRVAFSVMDVSKAITDSLVPHIKGQVDLGGYNTERGNVGEGKDNVHVWNDMNSYIQSLGLPYQKGFDYRHFRGTEIIPRLELSAGCRHRCTFCTIDRKVTNSPMSEVNAQVDSFKDLNGRLVYLNDKTFGQSPNVSEMPRLFKEMKEANPEFEGFIVQTTAAQMKIFTDQFLKDSGIKYIELGVETYNDPILKNLRKPATEALIDDAVEKMKRVGINFIPNIVIGFPEETAASYARTMDFLNKNSDLISHVNTYNLAIYEGTEISQKVKAKTSADADENSPNKSFYTDPKIHEDFAKQVYEYGSKQLDQPARFQPKTEAGQRLTDEGYEFERHGFPGYRAIQVKKDGEVVGEILSSRSPSDPKTVTIAGVDVKRSYRNQGIADAMYRELLTDLQADGTENVRGHVISPGPIRERAKLIPETTFEDTTGKTLSIEDAIRETPEYARQMGTQATGVGVTAKSPLRPEMKFQPKKDEPRAIKSAAIQLRNGRVFEGALHPLAHAAAEQALGKKIDFSNFVDGYTTNKGEFLNREDAYDRALELAQIDEAGAKSEGLAYDQTGKSGSLETDSFNNIRQFAPKTDWLKAAGDLYKNDPEHAEDFLGGRETIGLAAKAMQRLGVTTRADLNKLPNHLADTGDALFEFANPEPQKTKKAAAAPEPPVIGKDSFRMGKFGSDGVSKAWILPNGQLEPLGAQWHHDWLNQNKAELESRWKIDPASLKDPDQVPMRIAALKAGFARVNLEASGQLGIELRKSDLRKQKKAIYDLVEANAGKIDSIAVSLFNDGITKVVDSDTARVFQLSDVEKADNIPFVSKFQPKKAKHGETLGLPGMDMPREVLSTRALSEMNQKDRREHYPEAVVPRSAGEKIDSDIVGSPLYKQHKASESAAVNAFADRLESFAKDNESDPHFAEGAKWYSEFTPMLKKKFGADAEVMSELLAATSPNTNPEVNFGYAFDALRSVQSGRFDGIINKFKQGLEMESDGSWEKWYAKQVKAGKVPDAPETPTPASFMALWIHLNDLKPRQSNGALYGMHSARVLQVLSRVWLERNKGPKTHQFVENLQGKSDGATIDIWADRTMRWAGYEGFVPRWRILPENATGVSDQDFAFSQLAFSEAANRLNMKPSALQGALWFAEKKRWADNGWGRLDLGDFRTEIKRVPVLERRFQQNTSAPEVEQLGLDIPPRRK